MRMIEGSCLERVELADKSVYNGFGLEGNAKATRVICQICQIAD